MEDPVLYEHELIVHVIQGLSLSTKSLVILYFLRVKDNREYQC